MKNLLKLIIITTALTLPTIGVISAKSGSPNDPQLKFAGFEKELLAQGIAVGVTLGGSAVQAHPITNNSGEKKPAVGVINKFDKEFYESQALVVDTGRVSQDKIKDSMLYKDDFKQMEMGGVNSFLDININICIGCEPKPKPKPKPGGGGCMLACNVTAGVNVLKKDNELYEQHSATASTQNQVQGSFIAPSNNFLKDDMLP